MSVKASVSISDQQEEFARRLVDEGHFPSLSAVVEHGIDLVRQETAIKDAELAALKALLAERSRGPFVTVGEGRQHTEDMIATRKAAHGL